MEFSVRKSHSANGEIAFDLFRDGSLFGIIDQGRDGEWCFLDLDDERRGYRVRAKLARHLGRGKELKDMLAIIRREYERAVA